MAVVKLDRAAGHSQDRVEGSAGEGPSLSHGAGRRAT